MKIVKRVAGSPVRRAAGLTVVAVIAILLATSGAEAKGGSNFFGLDYSFHSLSDKDPSALQRSGAKTVRWTFFWPRIELKQGQLDWSTVDNFVGDLAAKGIKVLPTLYGSPHWLESRAVKPPVNSKKARDAWKNFATAAVERYGPNGSYWAGPYQTDHPGKAAIPIGTWQVWNEPNLKGAMDPPKPGVYAKVLKLAHGAITNANPKAKVMFAGMPGYSGDINAWDFIRGVYKKHAAKYFDIAALHPYARTVKQMLNEVERFRQAMSKGGDGHKPLWLTEIGWGSLPKKATPFGLTKGKQGQKRILKHAFKALKKKRHQWHIKRVIWFNFRDGKGGGVKTCSFCSSAGLLKNDFTPKPAWQAFRHFTH
jgi:hypothetical protein